MISKRSYKPELLDLGPSHYTEEEYKDCLIQLDRIGHLLGGNKATFQAFGKLPKPHSILDVGCGGGQLTFQLAEKFPGAQILGIDISPQAIEFAQKKLRNTPLNNLKYELSAEHLTFPRNRFDVVTCSLLCHHLNDQQLIDFLKRAYQIAKKAIIINDLHRHPLASLGFGLISKPLFRNRLISNDGLLSIKRAFKRDDWIHYLMAAEIPLDKCSITWHWAFRWILSVDTTSKKKI